MLRKNKLIKGFVLLMVIVVAGFGVFFKKTYSMEVVYTRSELQEMILSTALSYWYNNYYSNYSQKGMDSLSEGADDTNYYKVGTFLWRDLNTTPEMPGRSNYFHIDCSGYTFITYLNTFGYDLSEYRDINRYMIFHQSSTAYPMMRVNTFSKADRKKYYIEAYEYEGYGWNSKYLGRVANKTVDKCHPSRGCTYVTDGTVGEVLNTLNKESNKELVYYYVAEGHNDYTEDHATADEMKAVYSKVRDKLQIGDIIMYNRYEGDGDTAGHVMLYVGDIDGDGVNDLLHSTGVYSSDYNSSVDSEVNKLRREQSILKDNADEYVDYRIEVAHKNGGYVRMFAIYRPINTMCSSDTECKISNNSNNRTLTDIQLNNNKARVELKKLRREQWMTVSKDYSTTLNPTTSEKDGNTTNVVSKYNSINIEDEITYNLRLTNKLDNTSTKGIKINALIPVGSEFVSCNYSCNNKNGVISWNDQTISGSEEYKTYRFTVRTIKKGVLHYNGFKISTSDNVLQMDEMTVNVEPTLNGINKELLIAEVEKFADLVESGKITYSSTGSRTQNIKDLDSLESAKISQAGFIKMVYYNAYGLDFDQLEGTLDSLSAAAIKKAIFKLMDYPELNNRESKVNGVYPAYTGDTSINVYAKLIEPDVSGLTGVQANINKMLVPGMYGGRNLKGNDNKDRIKFLRSFISSSQSQSDLEFGDIIVTFSGNSSTSSFWLYLGFDQYGPVLARFENSGKFVLYTDKYLSKYYDDDNDLQSDSTLKPSNQILNEIFSKDLFVVLRPSKLGTTVSYNYNGGIEGVSSYVAFDKYKNLVNPVPIKDSYKVTLDYNNDNVKNASTTLTSTNTFGGWYYDNKKVVNSTNLLTSGNHVLKAKWITSEVKLPSLSVSGYSIGGWYSDSALKNKVANGGDSYIPKDNITLYAKWVSDDYLQINNLKVKDNKIIYKLNIGDTYTNLLKNIDTGGIITILDVNNNVISKNNKIATFNVIKIQLSSKTVQYKISVLGDITGSGDVNVGDIAKIYQNVKGKNTFSDVELLAGDVTDDGKILINDVSKLYSYLKGKSSSLN